MIVGADEAIRPSRPGVEAVIAFLPIFEDPRFLPEVVVAEEEGWTLEQYTRRCLRVRADPLPRGLHRQVRLVALGARGVPVPTATRPCSRPRTAACSGGC